MVERAKERYSKRGFVFLDGFVLLMVVFTLMIAASANGITDTTRPTVISVFPANNEVELSTKDQITVVFSEYMDPSTINSETVSVTQRTTPEFGEYRSLAIDTTVSTSGNIATIIPNDPLYPNQEFGNVFTVMITTGAKDLAGNSLSRDYAWSFTTGGDPFNTGATTSQLDQSIVPMIGPLATPIMSLPVAPTQVIAFPAVDDAVDDEETASVFPWYLVFGGLFVVVLIALVLYLIAYPTRDKNVKTIVRPSPFGDVHPVVDLEGIGPKYSKKLHTMGINDTKELWKADTVKVARDTGAPQSVVRSWQSMAELASVKDIGPQYAELLERSGVHSIDQLRGYDTKRLLQLVRAKQDSLKINIQGNTPGQAVVENWIGQARDHRFSESEGQTT